MDSIERVELERLHTNEHWGYLNQKMAIELENAKWEYDWGRIINKYYLLICSFGRMLCWMYFQGIEILPTNAYAMEGKFGLIFDNLWKTYRIFDMRITRYCLVCRKAQLYIICTPKWFYPCRSRWRRNNAKKKFLDFSVSTAASMVCAICQNLINESINV